VHTDAARESSGAARGAALALARFLFPSLCLACRRRPLERVGQGGVCADCWSDVPPLRGHRCAVCDESLADRTSGACGRCLIAPPPFLALRGAAPYGGTAREILLAFKFRGADYLARHLAALMASRLESRGGFSEVAAVPATRRARRRSDHAAEMLAGALASRLSLPFARRRLEKVRETERQSRLPLSRRESNVRGAFRARGRCRGHVLLVDDVVTSGATARECAGRLRAGGAQTVAVWCFARASRADVELELASDAPLDEP